MIKIGQHIAIDIDHEFYKNAYGAKARKTLAKAKAAGIG